MKSDKKPEFLLIFIFVFFCAEFQIKACCTGLSSLFSVRVRSPFCAVIKPFLKANLSTYLRKGTRAKQYKLVKVVNGSTCQNKSDDKIEAVRRQQGTQKTVQSCFRNR